MAETKIFVYGTLRKGWGNHVLLERAKFLQDLRVTGYLLLQGGIPYMIKAGDDQSVYGEVYEVDDTTLARCDRLEGHPEWYVRTEITEGLWAYLMPADRLRDAKALPIVHNGVFGGREYVNHDKT